MADLPTAVRSSSLHLRLQEDTELLNAVAALRSVAERLADTICRSVPAFTDHSIRHMDALWLVADRVLTEAETAKLSAGEAFVLASAFYLHDIGMAYAATSEGLARCQSAAPYKSFLAGIPEGRRSEPDMQARALAFAVRKLHATAATQLAIAPIPGTDIYLFESLTIREAWGQTCGLVAASHHWSLEEIERDLGVGGVVPLPAGRKGDLGYVAAILRIIDYAHINRERAPTIDRALRQPIERDSLVHWLAQEQIDGPEREGNELLYRAGRPLEDVDAWWLYYEMLVGLDAEIRAVQRYLDRRAVSRNRFALQSVRGANSPQEMAAYVPTSGFLPIEVNLRTGSIERLVQLLAGESLYGPDPMVPVRELIQNARDAVMLKVATAFTEADKAALSIPIKVAPRLRAENGEPTLEVKDWGVGMTRTVMTDYLISIASDYWASQFHVDFPTATERGFRPAGKFGIGFLAVFMLGEELTVESNRAGGERLQLTLRGVGRRGELRTVPPPSGSGTSVRVRLKEAVAEALRPLPELVRAYAPMLSHPLQVEVDGELTSIPSGWLFEQSAAEFREWVLRAIQRFQRLDNWFPSDVRRVWSLRTGFRESPSDLWGSDWPEYLDEKTRLLASFEGVSLLCVRGLALQTIRTPGFVGVIDLESAIPDVSRRRALQADVSGVMRKANEGARARIVQHLDSLATSGLLIDKLEFLDQCAGVYGRHVIRESSVPWISSLKLPGEVDLLSSAMLLAKLAQSRSLFVVFDTGPWTAMRRWVSSDPSPTADEPAVVLDGVGPLRPGYQSGSDERIGTLAQVWPDCGQAALFGTVLEIAAEAWQVNVGELLQQPGWRHGGSTVWGRLTKP